MTKEEKFFKLSEWDESFLQRLIDEKIEESLNLEYKRELPENKKFARSVSSFANENGGIIILGIAEEDGMPVELNPLEPNLKETIENIILTSISPKLPIKIETINSSKKENKKYYVIYIPKSNELHMVTAYKDFRYYKKVPTFQRVNFSTVALNDIEIKERIEKNVQYKKSKLEEIKNKRVLFFDEETWEAQKDSLDYLRFSISINFNLDLDSIKPELYKFHTKISGDLGLLLSNDIKTIGKSIVFEQGLIADKSINAFSKKYLLINEIGYIEYVRLSIKKYHDSSKFYWLRDNVIVAELKDFLAFLQLFISSIEYIGEMLIFVRLNDIRNSIIYNPRSINQYSQKSFESKWEDSKYYQAFEVIDNKDKIIEFFADGIYKNYGFEKSPMKENK